MPPDPTQTTDGATPIETPAIPEGFPTLTLDISDPALWEASGEHVLVPLNDSQHWVTIVDRELRPVWIAAQESEVLYAQVATSGDRLVWGETSGRARRVHLDARIGPVEINGHYHAMVEIEGGILAWDSGRVREWVPQVGSSIVSENYSPEYTNGISYDAALDAYVLSDFFKERVVAVARADGQVLWRTGGANGYTFDPPSSRFRNQHGIEWLDGNLLVSDSFAEGGTGLKEYEVDHDKEVLRLVWEYQSPYNVSAGWSWAHRVASGNTLHVLQRSGNTVYEVTPDKEVAWRAEFNTFGYLGRAEVIPDLYALIAPPPSVEE